MRGVSAVTAVWTEGQIGEVSLFQRVCGHKISRQGLAPTEERIASIIQAPAPRVEVFFRANDI